MARIRLQLTALAPLSFSARRGTASAFTDTLNYLPGTALRGAAAAHYLRNIGEPEDERFQNLFVNGGVHFANLYPQRSDDKSVSQALPATARSCKAHSGFLMDFSAEDETHGAGDILIRAAIFEMLGDKEVLNEVARCPQCSQPAHQFSGFYERAVEAPVYSKVEVYKRHLPHVGINRRTQTAEAGVLYAQEVINEARREKPDQPYEPQRFSGDLIVQDQHVEFVKDTLLVKGATMWVGESRSRGLGRVQVTECAITATDGETVLKSRIEAFNRQFSEQSREAEGRTFISLTLQSDAIVQDVFMRPKTRLETGDLVCIVSDRTVTQSFLPLQPIYANVGTRLVQSWNVASGYPKPDDVAIRMGSVFLFEVMGGLRDDLLKSLAVLQEGGVGKRRCEGFGRLTVCDPFHMEVNELWQTI